MKRLAGVLALGVLTGCGVTLTGPEGDPARSDGLIGAGGKVFIVQLAPSADVDATLEDLSRKNAAPITQRYRAALHGGALHLPTEAARLALLADPRVVQLDEDQVLEAIGKPGGGTQPTDAGTVAAQKSPTGYLLVGADSNANEGAGVRVAVLDTGVDLTHPDLAANLDPTYAKDCVNESGATYLDNHGHGTHVSGTIAAVDNTIGSVGIATQVKVVPVKVLDRRGSGTWSKVICGIDHVTLNAANIRVANMSLGGTGTECSTSACTKSALQVAVERSIAAGVTYVVAAGNEGIDASKSVPAAYQAAITVSAYRDANGVLDAADGWPTFTNYGSVVDLAAPGTSIYSTWKGGGYNTISGTSMASPHVAAAAALYLSTHPGISPQEVRDRLRANATTTYPGSTDPKHAEPLLDARGLTVCTQSCGSLGFNCGGTSDGCGGLLSCGTCAEPSVCTANVCVCVPAVTCETAGASCGALVDDCGATLDCGTCAEPLTCTDNVCG